MADDTKRCPGAPKYDIPAHDAPLDAFGKQSGNPDGLTRVCKADWNAYSARLRDAKKAGTFDPSRAPRPEPVKAAPRSRRKAAAEPVAEALADF